MVDIVELGWGCGAWVGTAQSGQVKLQFLFPKRTPFTQSIKKVLFSFVFLFSFLFFICLVTRAGRGGP
jgi:hypothetical protein